MTKEVGTLAELNVKPGDVVEFIDGYFGMYPEYKGKRMIGRSDGGASFDDGSGFCGDAYHIFRIISRASDKPEPKVETVTTHGTWCNKGKMPKTQYVYEITFNLIDGKPDWNTAKVVGK